MLRLVQSSVMPPHRHWLTYQNLSLFHPGNDVVELFLEGQRQSPLSYPHVGATDGVPPEGWDWSEDSLLVGHGLSAWEQSKEALNTWCQFDLSWVFPPRQGCAPGRGAGVWLCLLAVGCLVHQRMPHRIRSIGRRWGCRPLWFRLRDRGAPRCSG